MLHKKKVGEPDRKRVRGYKLERLNLDIMKQKIC